MWQIGLEVQRRPIHGDGIRVQFLCKGLIEPGQLSQPAQRKQPWQIQAQKQKQNKTGSWRVASGKARHGCGLIMAQVFATRVMIVARMRPFFQTPKTKKPAGPSDLGYEARGVVLQGEAPEVGPKARLLSRSRDHATLRSLLLQRCKHLSMSLKVLSSMKRS